MFTPSTPARSSEKSASGAQSAVANALLTPARPPQLMELSSVRRNRTPASWASSTSGRNPAARPVEAAGLSTRLIVAYDRVPRRPGQPVKG